MILPLTPIRFLLEAAENYGRKVGIVDGEKRLTYSEMLDRSSRLAAALRNLGIEDGDRVATLSFNCHQLLEAYYGVPIARAVLVCLNVRLSAEEQTYILEHSGSKIVLFDPEFQPLADVLRKSLPAIQWVALEARDGLPDWVHPRAYEELLAAAEPEPVDFTACDENALAELFYTSGSTGRPKGVMLSHRTLYLHALYALLGARRRAGNVAADQMCEMHTIPLFHANGWGRPHTITFAGGRHVIVKRFDPAEVCELIARERVTAFSMVPTMATTMVNFPGLGGYDLSSLQEVFIGGAAPSAALIREIEEKLGCRAFAGYGMTETSPVAAIAHIKDTLGKISEGERIRRQAMTGTALGGVEARVTAPDGKDVPKGWENGRGDPLPRRHRHGRLLARTRGNGGSHCEQLAALGRYGRLGRGKLLVDRRPQEGHHYQRRREHLVDRNRESAGGPRRRLRGRGCRSAGRKVG